MEEPRNIMQRILCCPRRIKPEPTEDLEMDTEREPSRSIATKKTHTQRVIEERGCAAKKNRWSLFD